MTRIARIRLSASQILHLTTGTLSTAFAARLENYNQQVAALDDLQNTLESEEDTLREMNKRMLSAVEAHYGPDSSEYEAAGGTRVSERKKASPKPTGGAPPTP